ncbi:MAG: hypothetical protein WA724_09150 [Candidatus Dormiibacterota bacterium]
MVLSILGSLGATKNTSARYDAEATVSAFAQRVRDDVDLAAVSSELVRAVQISVEPAHVSLWLRSTGSSL